MCGQREAQVEQFTGLQVQLQGARVAGRRQTVAGPRGVQGRQPLQLLTAGGRTGAHRHTELASESGTEG